MKSVAYLFWKVFIYKVSVGSRGVAFGVTFFLVCIGAFFLDRRVIVMIERFRFLDYRGYGIRFFELKVVLFGNLC